MILCLCRRLMVMMPTLNNIDIVLILRITTIFLLVLIAQLAVA